MSGCDSPGKGRVWGEEGDREREKEEGDKERDDEPFVKRGKNLYECLQAEHVFGGRLSMGLLMIRITYP